MCGFDSRWALLYRAWESLGFRLLREQESVSSNLTALTFSIAVGPVLVREGDC